MVSSLPKIYISLKGAKVDLSLGGWKENRSEEESRVILDIQQHSLFQGNNVFSLGLCLWQRSSCMNYIVRIKLRRIHTSIYDLKRRLLFHPCICDRNQTNKQTTIKKTNCMTCIVELFWKILVFFIH